MHHKSTVLEILSESSDDPLKRVRLRRGNADLVEDFLWEMHHKSTVLEILSESSDDPLKRVRLRRGNAEVYCSKGI